MKKFDIRSKKFIIILIVLNLIVLSLIIAVLNHNTAQRKQFNELIALCDLNISRNAYDTAESILQEILPFAVSRSQFLRILKRANMIAEITEDYQNLMLFSERAFKKFKNDRSILSIYIYSLIKNSNFTRAVTLIDNLIDENKKLVIPESLAYVLYAIKYKHDRDPNILQLIKNNDVRSIIEGSTDSKLYEQVYNISEAPIVLNNYLLSILLTGDYRKAASVLDNSRYKNQIYSELAGLIYYDNKNFYKAKEQFYKLFDIREEEITDLGIVMLLADALMHTDNYQEAYNLYDIIISNNERFSWIPYVNKDWINMVSGNRSFFIEEALDIFQGARKLAFLSILKNQHYEIDTVRNQDRYISEFWQFFAEESMTDEFKIFFVRELYRMGRFDEINIFTGKIDNIDREWAVFFNALTFFSRRENSNALQLFHKYYNITNDWRALYNMGIIELLNLNYETSANYFEIIVNKFIKNNVEMTSYDLYDIYLMLSFSLTMIKDYTKGRFYLNKTFETGHSSIVSLFLQNYYKTR